MPRAIWKGDVSFGLVNIPVALYSAERRNDLHFRLLDSRDCSHIRYERVNEETGEEVPWNEIVKGYEYKDGSFVVMESEDFERASVEKTHTIDVEDFVDRDSVDHTYFDKPYIIVPTKRGEKGYVLLRTALEKTNKIGIAKVVIRTRQHLAAVLPLGNALVVNLLRFAQELKDVEEFDVPQKSPSEYKISAKEKKLSEQLIDNMSSEWDPEKYHDDYREALMKYIEEKAQKGRVEVKEEAQVDESEDNVIDIMSLLRQSVGEGKPQESKRKSTKKPSSSRTQPKASHSKSKKKNSKKKSSTKKKSSKNTKSSHRKSS